MLYVLLFAMLLIASLGDLIIPIIIGTKYPGYNHLIDTISTLGTSESPVQKIESINLTVVGILFIIFAFGQWFTFEQKSWLHNWYTIGILIYAIGCILAGIFPEDTAGVAETGFGKIHGIASGLGFLFLIINPLWAVWMKEFRDLQLINAIFFVLAILTFTLFLISENKNVGFLKYTGLFQRLNLIVLYGTLIMNYLGLNKGS